MICRCRLFICGESGTKFFGKGPLVLLKNIDKYKSLNRAASEMNMSYHKALKIVKSAEEELGFSLLEKRIGGENGGGSLLTAEAYEFIRKYELFEKKAYASIDQLFSETFDKSEA